MKIGDKVRTKITEPGFRGKSGEIVATGQEGYDWQVRFHDAIWNDDTYYFNSDELEIRPDE